MNVTPCGTYHAKIESCETVTMADGKSVFKVYFVSIIGRDKPERTVWSACGLSKQDFLEKFKQSGYEGIGFVTAFPHITKVFRYAPKMEILMLVSAFSTKTGEAVNLDRGEGFTEFACLAEAMLANDEYRAWGQAATVEEYLQFVSTADDAPVVSNTKLAKYWNN